MNDSADGIYDDGEWISWDWINGQLYKQELAEEFPEADEDVINVFEDLVCAAMEYKNITGRYLQIWGELGELYAEIKYGLRRHKPGTPGSDGLLGDDLIEVKTISPEKQSERVQVKSAGDFNKLLVVKISEDFSFSSRMIDRQSLGKGGGKHARIHWDAMPDK